MGLQIRLVEPRPAGHNIFDRVLVPRLGLPLMGKMLAESGHDVRIYCEVLAPVDLDDLLGADLVGISSTTPPRLPPTGSPTSSALPGCLSS